MGVWRGFAGALFATLINLKPIEIQRKATVIIADHAAIAIIERFGFDMNLGAEVKTDT